jgi:hypothetical protein
LPSIARERLIEADLPFLRRQLGQERIGLLLLNGSGIVRAYCDRLGGAVAEIPIEGHSSIKLFVGQAVGGQRIVGWNINLQSSFGVRNAQIDAIGAAVREVVSPSGH